MACALTFALALFVDAGDLRAGDDHLERGFRTPPDSVRPWVYWVWMDGNLTREGITADLESMKKAGIGGVMIMEVNVGVPRGPVGFMSPSWRNLFKHVVTEADRCGIEVALLSGPGWCGSGGPWVTPGESMQLLVGAMTEVSGPTAFEGSIPRGARRRAFFGDGHLPAPLEEAKDDYYRDVAVLAYPAPPAHDTIPDIDEKALYVRAPYSSQKGVRPFIPSLAGYPPGAPGGGIDPGSVVDLTARLSTGGRLSWQVPPGRWTIARFGRTSNGANTRPAPVPGLGLECDKLDTAALNAHYDSFIGSLVREIGPRGQTPGRGWTMLHIDSWEMGAQNWTGAFREEFRKRRGYDLFPYLPALTGAVVGDRETSERFLWDLRATAGELLVENHGVHFRELGRRDGFTLSVEPYDMTPCADMSFGSVADVPMCEFWLYGFNTSYSVLEATSIAHTCGRPEVDAEAFTSGDEEKWQARVDEGARRLGVRLRREPVRVSQVTAPAVAPPGTRHDDGALRGALGEDANLVGDGPRLSRVPFPLPVPSQAGAPGGRRLFPRPRGIAPGLPPPFIRGSGESSREARVQFRRLRPRCLHGADDRAGRPAHAPRRHELPRACPPGA